MEKCKEIKILIIDDDILSLSIMHEILHKSGFENISTASCGEEGLRLIARDQPDLIVLDSMLPDTGGLILCKKLKQDKATADIPVFILTGASVEYAGTLEAAFEAGASEFFTKPVRSADFLPRLRAALGSKKLLDQVLQETKLRHMAEQEQKRLIDELQHAIESIKTLKGLLPMCSTCRKIRTDDGSWQNVERYIYEHAEAHFTHGICPECAEKLYPEGYKKNVPGVKQRTPTRH